MKIYKIKDKCPFCSSKLRSRTVYCPNHIDMLCFECIQCKSYFYTAHNYNRINRLAKERNRNLNERVFAYEKYDTASKKQNKKAKVKTKNYKVNKNKINSGKILITKIPVEIASVDIPKIKIRQSILETCRNYKKGYCIYLDDKCNPYSIKCENKLICTYEDKMRTAKTKENKIGNDFKITAITRNIPDKNIGITAVVLSDNRKCTYRNHDVIDIAAFLRIVTPSGNITQYSVQASYCNICNEYFILKSEYRKAKEVGFILCPIIDRTSIKGTKKRYSYSAGNESNIHQLGYNVNRNNNYTTKQRHVILANIIENTSISKQEIISNISRCIAQHQKQSNYAQSVSCWHNDLEFIKQYELGDIPQVKVNKIILKYSKSE